MLLHDELSRYARHFALDEIGQAGQATLKKSRVLCVGAGGLGNPVLLYLAAAGVGNIGIVDNDTVDVSNLQRQILYDPDNVALKKTAVAKAKLTRFNPHINVIVHEESLTDDNALTLLADYDVITDCTDNFAARYLINDACFHLQKPNVFASISQFEGQCTIFCAEDGPCYRCLYSQAPPPGLMPNCAEGGVLGVLPGLMGVIQATEVIKWLLKIGDLLVGRLLFVNALDMRFREFAVKQHQDCALCSHQIPFQELVRPKGTCSIDFKVDEITVKELAQQLKSQKLFLLDVREPYEYNICNIGGHLIPLRQLSRRINEVDQTKPIVVHCKSGARSKQAIKILEEAGISHAKNLHGGILKWIEDIDTSLPRY